MNRICIALALRRGAERSGAERYCGTTAMHIARALKTVERSSPDRVTSGYILLRASHSRPAGRAAQRST